MLSDVKHLDPAFDLLLQPVKLWAIAVWSGAVDQLRRMAVAFQETKDFAQAGGNLEKRPPGPSVAVLMALDRLQWKAINFREFVTDRGVALNLSQVCPRSVLLLGRMSVEQWQWRRVAEHYPDEYTDFVEGGDLQPLLKELGKKCTMPRAQRVLVRCAATRCLGSSFQAAVKSTPTTRRTTLLVCSCRLIQIGQAIAPPRSQPQEAFCSTIVVPF